MTNGKAAPNRTTEESVESRFEYNDEALTTAGSGTKSKIDS